MSASFIFKEIQIKSTKRYHFACTGIAEIDSSKCWQGSREAGASNNADENIEGGAAALENSSAVPHNGEVA